MRDDNPSFLTCFPCYFSTDSEIFLSLIHILHGFLVTGVLGFDLFHETGRLVFRIVQFGETVGDFTADHEELEAFRNAFAGIGRAGQW